MKTGRAVNESVPEHIADLTIKALNDCHKTLRDSRVLVLGLSYKPGVGDIRSSKVADVVDELAEYSVDVEGFDPFADTDAVQDAFSLETQESLSFEASMRFCWRRPMPSSNSSISRSSLPNSRTVRHSST